MEIELLSKLYGEKLKRRNELLIKCGLTPDENIEQTVLIYDNDFLVATGSRTGNLLKCIAVDDKYKGEGLTATLLTELRKDAFNHGHRHMFLYTKPQNMAMFESLFFYPVAKTDKVLLMEDKKNGIVDFINSLSKDDTSKKAGAVVMNCNPFTLGHRYLIEKAASECDRLYVFVLSEDKSRFSAKDRIEMVRLGTSDIPNVSVFPTGPYLISSATFPTYFLKERDKAEEVQCLLDIEIFVKYFVPYFGITTRFIGTEPYSKATDLYNRALNEWLPKNGVDLIEIPRLEMSGSPVSASRVRELIDMGDINSIKKLVPMTTFDYLQRKGII